MYHTIEGNKLYDITKEEEVEIDLLKGKGKYDIIHLLDDVSTWMEENKDFISEGHLPFAILAVGSTPIQISAFLYGMFIGKALEKNKAKIQVKTKKVSKEKILSIMDNNMKDYTRILDDIIKGDKKEKGNDGRKESPEK